MSITVSIILVNYNGADVLVDCLKSINKFVPGHNCEVIVVDNASQDNSVDIIENKFPNVQLIKLTKNVGFGAGNNAGAKVAKGEFLFLLNTDTIITSNILPHLVDLMEKNPTVGIIGPKLLFPDGRFQISFSPTISIKGELEARKLHRYAESRTKLALLENNFQKIQEVDIVVGAAFFIRGDLFRTLGGFDEKFFMYFEESDLCQRAKNIGYEILYTPKISLIHVRGYSTSKLASPMAVEYRRSQLYYYQKHRPLWERLILQIYLLISFLYKFIITSNPYCWQIVILVLKNK